MEKSLGNKRSRIGDPSKYKPCGVQRLGAVPEDLEVKRGRFAMRVNPPSPPTNRHIYITRLARMPSGAPRLPEQAAIAAYLDEETAKLDGLVGKEEAAVDRLQEYRTALIIAATTGRVGVRKTAVSS